MQRIIVIVAIVMIKSREKRQLLSLADLVLKIIHNAANSDISALLIIITFSYIAPWILKLIEGII